MDTWTKLSQTTVCVIVMISSVIYDLMFRFTRDGRDSHSGVKDPGDTGSQDHRLVMFPVNKHTLVLPVNNVNTQVTISFNNTYIQCVFRVSNNNSWLYSI